MLSGITRSRVRSVGASRRLMLDERREAAQLISDRIVLRCIVGNADSSLVITYAIDKSSYPIDSVRARQCLAVSSLGMKTPT